MGHLCPNVSPGVENPGRGSLFDLERAGNKREVRVARLSAGRGGLMKGGGTHQAPGAECGKPPVSPDPTEDGPVVTGTKGQRQTVQRRGDNCKTAPPPPKPNP